MLSVAAKSLLGTAAFAFIAAIAYAAVAHEESGAVALGFVALGAFLLAVVSLMAGTDSIPVVTGEPLNVQNPPAGGRPLPPSFWPVGAALAIGLFTIGAATGAVVVVPAIFVAVAVTIGWLFQAWTEHPIFTARFGGRMTDRLLVPIGLPVGVFALVLIIALSLSRVLLAVPEQGSRIIAITVAIVILGSAFFIVSQENMAKIALRLLSAFALVAVLAAGVAGFAYGERHFDKKGGTGPTAPAVPISASDILNFSTAGLSFPAGVTVPLVFDNATAAVPHNVGIYDHQGGNELFRGDLVTGPKKVTYHVPPLNAGTYYFQCDVHTNMRGTLTVSASGA